MIALIHILRGPGLLSVLIHVLRGPGLLCVLNHVLRGLGVLSVLELALAKRLEANRYTSFLHPWPYGYSSYAALLS